LPRATRPGESWHSDIWGPFPHPSVGNFRYFVTFIDDYSTLKPQHPTVFHPFASARSRNPTFIPLSTTSSLPLEVPQPSLSPSSAPHVPVPLTMDVRLPQRQVQFSSLPLTSPTRKRPRGPITQRSFSPPSTRYLPSTITQLHRDFGLPHAARVHTHHDAGIHLVNALVSSIHP
jgi:hypothetical protein